ncbi:hypothetical protein PSEEN2759 [Pseudomonas entomophila L48]|uniref:Uncharacterized protein n=1 Tax=Pseudomonas entomophila (strain L48) TaxID=384676 RepID=Q1I9Y0_PSEE4|nr:hypothetical protein PSEEN2759 [Pseudomonas entomophila L48]
MPARGDIAEADGGVGGEGKVHAVEQTPIEIAAERAWKLRAPMRAIVVRSATLTEAGFSRALRLSREPLSIGRSRSRVIFVVYAPFPGLLAWAWLGPRAVKGRAVLQEK